MSNPEGQSGQSAPGWGPPPGSQPPPGWPPGGYPQQTLSNQDVQQGRSRKPLVIGLVVALLLAAGGLVAWQLLKDDGEGTRAAYCSALRNVTHNGDLMEAIAAADASTLTRLTKVQQLAPSVIKDDWNSFQSLAQSTQSGNVDYNVAIKALTALKNIADDAKSNCSITINVPGLP